MNDSIYTAIEAAADSAWRAVLTAADSATWVVLISDVRRLFQERQYCSDYFSDMMQTVLDGFQETWDYSACFSDLEAQAVWDSAAAAAYYIERDKFIEFTETRSRLGVPTLEAAQDSAAAPARAHAQRVLTAYLRPVFLGGALLAVVLVCVTGLDYRKTLEKQASSSVSGGKQR